MWDAIIAQPANYEQAVEAYAAASGYGASFEIGEDRLTWTFEFPGGVDYDFYWSWRDQWIAEVNASMAAIGLRYEIDFDGPINVDSSPWRNVTWLPTKSVYSTWLEVEGLGWIFTPDWAAYMEDPSAGPIGFIGYANDIPDLEWFWAAYGWYYNYLNGRWLYNYTGTAWFWDSVEGWVLRNAQ